MRAFDYVCMHSPYNKLVQKGFARLVNGDLLAEPTKAEWAADAEAQTWAKVPAAESVARGCARSEAGPSSSFSAVEAARVSSSHCRCRCCCCCACSAAAINPPPPAGAATA